jgi:hypothetical protein
MLARKRKPKKATDARPYQVHALTSVLRGDVAGVDGRKAPFRAAFQLSRALAEQLGGELAASQAAKLHLLERKVARLSTVYAWLEPKLVTDAALALVNSKRRQPYALAAWLDAAEDSVLRLLAQLEASTAKKPPLDLNAYLAQTYGPKKRARARYEIRPRPQGKRSAASAAHHQHTTAITPPTGSAATTASDDETSGSAVHDGGPGDAHHTEVAPDDHREQDQHRPDA